MPDASLAGAGILLTRPRQQADELEREIAARGGNVLPFPCIDIVGIDTSDVARDLASLANPDITIFISTNAVEHGLQYAGGDIAAIGPSTAAAIERAGQAVAISPSTGFDSEHLLMEPAFADVTGKTIRIIRGNGGREYLADQLTERGARVEYLAAYERRLPTHAAPALERLEKDWRAGIIDAVVVMSVQSFDNLQSLLPDWCRQQLPATLLVTPSSRVLKEVLTQYPGCPVTLAAGPQPVDIAECLAKAIDERNRTGLASGQETGLND